MKLERILVATDFSEASTKAFDQSVALARGGAAEIHVVHRLASIIPAFPPVAHPGATSWTEIGPALDEYTGELRADATRRLEELVKRGSDASSSEITFETSVEETLETVDAVLQKVESWKPDLLALGTRGREGIERLVMGSVAAKLLHHAETAVMLVRADSELYDGVEPIGPILVPIDFSDHSHRALAYARLLASRHRGSLHLLHAVELMHTPLSPGGLTSRFEAEPGLREKYVEALTDMLGDTEGEVDAVDGSSSAGAILASREKLDARLVVMGSRGLSGLPNLLVGSVAEKVARFCEVPVLIVK